MKQKTLRVLEYYKIIELLSKKAESELGKSLVKELKPSSDLNEVKKLLKETDEAFKIIVKVGYPPLGGLHDIASELTLSTKGGTLSPGALLRVADTLRAGRRMKNFLLTKSDEARGEMLSEMAERIGVFRDVEDEIFEAIIGESDIADDASAELKSIRRQIKNKNDSVRSRLNSIINSTENRKYLQDAIVTMREGRHVVPVRQEYRNVIKGIIHDQSSSGATLFIEPMEIVNLNNDLRELELKEKAEIERILKELTAKVAEIAYEAAETLKILARLDFIFAKAKLAIDMDATPPEVNDRGYINIKSGRHPLIDKKHVVPTNFYLGDPTNTIVVTGPNTGGKTVTLKTVGLLTLMAQSGLQIPAEGGSSIGVFKSVFADIGDEQSIEQSLSTFSSHMTNIVDLLDHLEDNSLVLFDELGAGTDPTEGAALAISILEYLFERNIRTVATTHYSELKLYALSTEGVENASVEFDVETLSPTYRLLIGVPGKSNAFEISRRLGLQDDIIERAKSVISSEDIEFEDILSSLEADRRAAERSKEEVKKLELELKEMKAELEEKTSALEKSKEEIIFKAKRDAKSILSKAKKDSEYALKEIKEVTFEIEEDKKKRLEDAKRKLKNNLDNIEYGITEKILSKVSAKPLADVKVGAEVRVLSLNQNGTVMSKVDSDGNVVVQIGVMRVTVPLNTIELATTKAQKQTNQYAKTMIKKKAEKVKGQIDIRGQNVEEASYEVDKYLDDAYISGLKEVHIIHGKGTGVLRSGIEKLLKSHKHVKSHRLGSYTEGGTGATVVELK